MRQHIMVPFDLLSLKDTSCFANLEHSRPVSPVVAFNSFSYSLHSRNDDLLSGKLPVCHEQNQFHIRQAEDLCLRRL